MDRIYHEPVEKEEKSLTESLQQKKKCHNHDEQLIRKRTDISFKGNQRGHCLKTPTLIQTSVVSS